ncbi:MAG: serine/threonine-protein kinase, partial [Microbispora sp.]|nr:serine/threonine-protein kinase [Microbispora sp.]
PYRIVARLGSGGMGRVYLGRSKSGRAVAVKVVRPDLAEDGEFRRRFAREVAVARTVNGFFTAGVVAAEPHGSPPWLATAYVPGVSLDRAIAEYGPWPEASVLALGAGLAEALESIHAAGVVHRDLKPSNVLLAADGPRVIDFGISVAVEGSRLTQTGMIVGTPGFMSPEQLTGAPVGPATDVFCLGAVLAFAATGAGPFGSGSWQALLYRVVHQEPDLGALGPRLRSVVGRCLAKQPERRPSASALLDELAESVGGNATLVEFFTESAWLPDNVARVVRDRVATPPPATPLPATPPLPDTSEDSEVRVEPVVDPATISPDGDPREHQAVVHSTEERGNRNLQNPSNGGLHEEAAADGSTGDRTTEVPRRTVLLGLAAIGAVAAGVIGWQLHEGTPDTPGANPATGTSGPHTGASPTLAQKSPTSSRTLEHGALKWSVTTGGEVYSSPAVVDGVVYVGSWDHKLYAIDAATGRKRWSFTTGAWVYSTPAVADGVVYVGSDDSELYAIDAATGRKRWSFTTGRAVESSPAVADGVVYVGSWGGKLHAIDAATGRKRWSFTTGDSVDSSPVVVDGVVYVGSNDHKLYAVDAVTGRERWHFATGNWVESSPVVADGVVYVGSNDHKLYAIDAVTGRERWSFTTGRAVESSPAVVDGVVYVGSNDHKLYAVDAVTGRERWHFPTGDLVDSSPAVVDGVVYVGSADGKLYAVDAVTGRERWHFTIGAWVRSSPAVVDGVVYVGSEDHKLYAITGSSGAVQTNGS